MLLVAISMIVVTFMSLFHVAPFENAFGPGYTMVATHGTYGIIIHEQYAGRFLGGDAGTTLQTWTPSRDDVAHAEELLRNARPDDAIDAGKRAEADSPEDLVSRTWYGAIVDGERLMYVNGYCSGGLPESPLVPVWVLDGGSCYWNAIINADTWKIVSYGENGEA
jgi:hypothetical protein